MKLFNALSAVAFAAVPAVLDFAKGAHAALALAPALATPPKGLATPDSTDVQLVGRSLQVETVTRPTNHVLPYDNNPSTCADDDFVNCIEGFADGQSCEEACRDENGVLQCCDGDSACASFTGKVCKDGSCSGTGACYDANVAEVINSCKPWDDLDDGTASCSYLNALSASPSTLTIIDSCWGHAACLNAGLGDDGTIGNIRNSCHGTAPFSAPLNSQFVCKDMGQHGVVGDIINSCYGIGSCYRVGFEASPGITKIEDSCDGCVDGNPISNECSSAKTDDELIANDQSCNPPTPATPPPTPSPTPPPTPPPTVIIPWDVDYQDIASNFTKGSDQEITLRYNIGKGRYYKTSLKAYGCDTPLDDSTGVFPNEVGAVVVNPLSSDPKYNELVVVHDIVKDNLNSSSPLPLWDGSSLKFCQVVQIVESSPIAEGEEKDMIVWEDERNVEINFELQVAYSLDPISVSEADLGNVTDEIDFEDNIAAFKCNDEYKKEETPLVENEELGICVVSNTNDITVDWIYNLTISQGATQFNYIVNSDVVNAFSGFTRLDIPVSQNAIRVITRVPGGIFNYTSGSPLSVTGIVDLKLNDFDSSTPVVPVVPDIGTRRLQATDTEASFNLDVALEPAYGDDAMMNPAMAAGMTKAITLIVMMVGSVYALI